jgi:hypothetical protein
MWSLGAELRRLWECLISQDPAVLVLSHRTQRGRQKIVRHRNASKLCLLINHWFCPVDIDQFLVYLKTISDGT